LLKIIEFLDIEKIEDIRKRVLNKNLDKFDNFSFHLALIEEGVIHGVGRLYKQNGNIVIDNIAVEKFAESKYYEILFRALLNKSQSIECNYVTAKKDKETNFYFQFGFDKELKVKSKDIIFKCGCIKEEK